MCNVDTYAEVGWFRRLKISKDMSTEKPIKRDPKKNIFSAAPARRENFMVYNCTVVFIG